jgi:hypothetical protein
MNPYGTETPSDGAKARPLEVVWWYTHTTMAREKVTLTLDSDYLRALRDLVGARSLSAAVDNAILAYLSRLRHFAAVDEWLLEMEREHGPVPPQTLEWASRLVGEWTSPTKRRRRAG